MHRRFFLVHMNTLTLLSSYCLLVSSAGNLCKQFGPRSGQTKCWALSGFKLFDTLMVFLDFFFEKVNFENQQTTKNHEKLPITACQKCRLKFSLLPFTAIDFNMYANCMDPGQDTKDGVVLFGSTLILL